MTPTENPQKPILIIQATLQDLESIVRKVMQEYTDPSKTRLKDVAFTVRELGEKIGVSTTTAYRLHALGFLESAQLTTEGGATVFLVEEGREAYARYREYLKTQR